MIYCSRCKQNKEEGLVHARHKSTFGNLLTYYHCRECNTKRCAKYRKTKTGRKNINNAVYRSIKNHPIKQKARMALVYAVKMGRVIKPDHCEVCANTKVESHHSNYRKPFDVRWLCRQHHRDLHKKSTHRTEKSSIM